MVVIETIKSVLRFKFNIPRWYSDELHILLEDSSDWLWTRTPLCLCSDTENWKQREGKGRAEHCLLFVIEIPLFINLLDGLNFPINMGCSHIPNLILLPLRRNCSCPPPASTEQ